MHLDVFKEDPEFAQHEEEYQAIKREILGDEEEESEEEGSERERGEGEGSSEEEESSEDDEATGGWTCGGCMYCINMPASWGGCVWQLAALASGHRMKAAAHTPHCMPASPSLPDHRPCHLPCLCLPRRGPAEDPG
jgi:hypothetical protein